MKKGPRVMPAAPFLSGLDWRRHPGPAGMTVG